MGYSSALKPQFATFLNQAKAQFSPDLWSINLEEKQPNTEYFQLAEWLKAFCVSQKNLPTLDELDTLKRSTNILNILNIESFN